MKKIVVIGGMVLVVLVIVGFVTGFIIFSPTYAFWLDEGDPGFEKSVEVKNRLERTMPGRNYLLRYYKKHSDPNLVNSIYVQYSDPGFNRANVTKYADATAGSGEFAILGSALCQDTQLKNELGYKAVTFHVVSADSGVREFYEHTWVCTPSPQ